MFQTSMPFFAFPGGMLPRSCPAFASEARVGYVQRLDSNKGAFELEFQPIAVPEGGGEGGLLKFPPSIEHGVGDAHSDSLNIKFEKKAGKAMQSPELAVQAKSLVISSKVALGTDTGGKLSGEAKRRCWWKQMSIRAFESCLNGGPALLVSSQWLRASQPRTRRRGHGAPGRAMEGLGHRGLYRSAGILSPGIQGLSSSVLSLRKGGFRYHFALDQALSKKSTCKRL